MNLTDILAIDTSPGITDEDHAQDNRVRARFALDALIAFKKSCGERELGDDAPGDTYDAMQDLIADLLHLDRLLNLSTKLNVESPIARARAVFEEEVFMECE